MTEIEQMLLAIDRDMVEVAKKMFKVEGEWYYRDLPRITPEHFDTIVDTLGADNIRWITFARYEDNTMRGQMIYNEQARLNAGNYFKR